MCDVKKLISIGENEEIELKYKICDAKMKQK